MTSNYYYNLGERPDNEKPPSRWWVFIAMGILVAAIGIGLLFAMS